MSRAAIDHRIPPGFPSHAPRQVDLDLRRRRLLHRLPSATCLHLDALERAVEHTGAAPSPAPGSRGPAGRRSVLWLPGAPVAAAGDRSITAATVRARRCMQPCNRTCGCSLPPGHPTALETRVGDPARKGVRNRGTGSIAKPPRVTAPRSQPPFPVSTAEREAPPRHSAPGARPPIVDD